MSQIVFALFEDRIAWNKAKEGLISEEYLDSDTKFTVHDSNTEDDELSFEESDLGNGLSRGFFFGILFGFAVGFFGSWFVGFNMFGPWEYGMLASLGFGLFGALGGVLAGSILPNPRLKQMLDNMGDNQIVVTAKVSDSTLEGKLEEKLLGLGALKVTHSFSLA